MDEEHEEARESQIFFFYYWMEFKGCYYEEKGEEMKANEKEKRQRNTMQKTRKK